MMKLAATGCVAVLLLTPGIALAGAESGFYMGGSLGSANLDISTTDVNIDDDDTAYKIFAGYNFGLIPLIDLAVEGSYVDLGEASSVQIGDSNVGVTGWDVFGLAGFKLGPIGLFGKAGFIDWDSESDIFQDQLDDSGTDPAYGIGARFQIGSASVRAEYEWFELDIGDIEYLSVGASWTF